MKSKREFTGFIRWSLLAAGTLSLAIGIVGIFLPLLPTTPFVLLAAILYARSSKRFYNWLLYNRLFGRYIRNYLDGKGIPLLAKVISISLLWITLGSSAIFFVSMLIIRIILLLVGIGVSIHILLIPTLKVDTDE
ncbi:MAG: YbaN family protein [Spirochaetota bacterium]|nr:MAG: YbaN family protein [Spirochaetota bacterium]